MKQDTTGTSYAIVPARRRQCQANYSRSSAGGHCSSPCPCAAIRDEFMLYAHMVSTSNLDQNHPMILRSTPFKILTTCSINLHSRTLSHFRRGHTTHSRCTTQLTGASQRQNPEIPGEQFVKYQLSRIEGIRRRQPQQHTPIATRVYALK